MIDINNLEFQSTLPVWGATIITSNLRCFLIDFNPRSPCGERLVLFLGRLGCGGFQSTLPVWGATVYTNSTQIYMIISIHAPRVGSDGANAGTRTQHSNFNPRSPCGERRNTNMYTAVAVNISIHAPRVGSDGTGSNRLSSHDISIHAPRVGSDIRPPVWLSQMLNFNPRSPCGERLCGQYPIPEVYDISIHAPRVGSDHRAPPCGLPGIHFNPRSPCGERRSAKPPSKPPTKFQSTLPVWGATLLTMIIGLWCTISIHAPRVGSDCCFN